MPAIRSRSYALSLSPCMMRPSLVPFCLFLTLLGPTDGLYIASFNIQIFGMTKFDNQEVVNILAQIVRRYDLVFIQEIRDKSQTVIHKFLEVVNGDKDDFNVTVSPRLGTTSSKEQYAFMYRKSEVEIVEYLVHGEPNREYFERPPFVARINSLTLSGLPDFILIGVHIRPASAETELNNLVSVYEDMNNYFGINRALLLGDFNADCRYLSNRAFNRLNLTADNRFTWLIDEDTTIANSSCAYDRFVAASGFHEHVINGSVAVFRFDKVFDLDAETTAAVSDHYPIELRLQGTDIANAMANDNDSDNSDTAQTMSLSCVVVLSAVVVTTHLLM